MPLICIYHLSKVKLYLSSFIRSWETFVNFTYFRVFLVVVLLGPDPPAHQVVSHRVRQGEVVIPLRGHVSVLHQCEVEVPVEVSLQVRHVLHTG